MKDVIFADNKISASLNVYGPNPLSHKSRDNNVTITRSLFVGKSSNFDCVKDNIIPYHASFYPQRSPRAFKGQCKIKTIVQLHCQ